MGLAVLTGLNLLNYLDRYVLPAVEESVKHDLRLPDWQTGLLATAFISVFIVASPIFGYFGDRSTRTRLVALGSSVWSLATVASGLARGFPSLLAARMTVGVGEAGYGTISPALLADYYPKKVRGRIFSIYYAAIPIGSALGYLVGGLLNHALGWRAAFFVTGGPGILLAAVALMLSDPPRGILDEKTEEIAPPVWETYRTLLRNKFYVLTVAGYVAGTFGIGGISFWMPAFLTRSRGFSVTEAPTEFGGIIAIAGFVGTLGGGWLADWLQARIRSGYLWMMGTSTLLAVPFAFAAFLSPDRAVLMRCLLIASTLLFASTGPVNALLVNLVAPRTRASAVALATVCIHLFGDALSPFLIGAVSSHYGNNLSKAVLIAPIAVMVSGIIWIGAAWHETAMATIRRPRKIR